MFLVNEMYHGRVSYEESRTLLERSASGTFLLRSTHTGHLVFTFKDRGRIRDIIIPRKGHDFFKNNPGLQETVLDTANFVVTRCSMLTSPLPPPAEVQEQPLLQDVGNNTRKDDSEGPVLQCPVCDKEVSASAHVC